MVQGLGFTCSARQLLEGVEGADGEAPVLVYQVHLHVCLEGRKRLAAQAGEYRMHQVLACSRVLIGRFCFQ